MGSRTLLAVDFLYPGASMTSSLLTLTLAVLAGGDALSPGETPRKSSPYAPSLPYLSKQEEERIDQVIDQFILADTGRLRGADARTAMRDFEGLKPEAIPALI